MAVHKYKLEFETYNKSLTEELREANRTTGYVWEWKSEKYFATSVWGSLVALGYEMGKKGLTPSEVRVLHVTKIDTLN